MADPQAPDPAPQDAIRRLADAHTVAILVFLIGAPITLALAVLPASEEPPILPMIARVAIGLVMAVALFRLARLLGEPGAVIWALVPLVHFMLGVLAFAILNVRTRRRLRAQGVEVGPLGARPPPTRR